MGWPGYTAPTEAPLFDALGCAAQLLSPADSDGSDSFQRWPPVLTPIQLADSGKLALALYKSAQLTGKVSVAAVGLCRHLTSASLI